ncbi:MAG: hypothetical protein P8012_10925 [Desulfobacterales bacterium]
MKKVLNIIRSAPDDLEKKLIAAFSGGEGDKTISLYEGDVNWSYLVDEIFLHDQLICWW